MKNWLKLTMMAGLLALASGAAFAQQKAPAAAAGPSPAAIASAKEILAMKNAGAMYASAVPNIVQRNKDALLQNNLNYQKDLNEVALTVAQSLNGREKEIGELMAKIYATDFTEQELKDLVVFYKTPLGQKLLTQEPRSIQSSIGAMNQWAQTFSEEVDKMFRAEMRKRGKEL
jgi:hypothetical protein